MATFLSKAPRLAVFFSTSGHSGVDRIAQNLLPALADKGLRVDLLKVRGHGPNLDADALQKINVIDLGHAHTYASLGALVRYLRNNSPDVLLADKDRVNRVALLAKALARVKTRLLLCQGTTISVDLAHRGLFERWLQRFSIGHLYRFAHSVVVTSEGVARDMVAYTGLDEGKIQVVPCPVVSADLFSLPQPLPDHPWYGKGKPHIILGVGELCYRKDFATLLKAFAMVRKTMTCRLVILGRGKERERLLHLADDLGIRGDVSLPGYQSNPYPFMAHASVLVHASRWEGLGFVLIEALALGTPVVATDCPSGPAEILKHGCYGHLVPVGDPVPMAEAILKTLQKRLPPEFLKDAARPYEIGASVEAYIKVMGL